MLLFIQTVFGVSLLRRQQQDDDTHLESRNLKLLPPDSTGSDKLDGLRFHYDCQKVCTVLPDCFATVFKSFPCKGLFTDKQQEKHIQLPHYKFLLHWRKLLRQLKTSAEISPIFFCDSLKSWMRCHLASSASESLVTKGTQERPVTQRHDMT